MLSSDSYLQVIFRVVTSIPITAAAYSRILTYTTLVSES